MTTSRTHEGRRRPQLKIIAAGALALLVILTQLGPGTSTHAQARTGPEVVSSLLGQRRDLGAAGLTVGVVQGDHEATGAVGAVRADRPLIIGSVTKAFTALAIMQLVEAGRIRLDDPVHLHLPGFRTADHSVSDTITVRQLLDQTSGLTTAAGEDPFSQPQTSLDGQVRALRSRHDVRPGAFEYSNANYEVLGALIETVSGLSYGTYLSRHVLRPLAMTHTYTNLTAARAAGLEQGHRIWFGVPVPDGTYYRSDFLPAGFLVSTPADLDRFASALLHEGTWHGRRILSANGVHQLLSASTDASTPGLDRSYGFGWFQQTVQGEHLVYVPGSAHSVHADLVLDTTRGTAVTLLADSESMLYFVLPKFDLVAFNGAALAGGEAPQGTIRGLYVVFDLLVGLALYVYLRQLVRLLRGRARGFAGLSRLSLVRCVWRELIAPIVIVSLLPGRLGFGWPVLVRSDLGLMAATIVILGISTFTMRLATALMDRRLA